MAASKRKQLEHRITEKLIAMSQTSDLDKIYQFYSELAEYLTTKQLNVIDMYSFFGFENFEEYYTLDKEVKRFEVIDKKSHVITKDNMTSTYHSKPKETK